MITSLLSRRGWQFVWVVAMGCLLSPFLVRAEELPLRRVVLFSAGVGFFEHAGQLIGDQSVEMSFADTDINDLLKSLVVQDFGGGVVSSVTYGTQDPVAKTLRTFAVDLTDELTLAGLLSQLRGAHVRVQSEPVLEGMILGVEVRTVRAGEEVAQSEWLTVRTEDGIRSVELGSVQSIKLLDERVDKDLQAALELIASSRQSDQKKVTIEFRGEGQRQVKVGYIREFPLWKTSYRLVLDDEKAPFLQGWAIVENITDQDWQDVQLTLVSGRPVSFVMQLDQPLYLQRPQIMPELHGAVAPRVYDRGRGAMGSNVGPLDAGSFGGAGGGMGGMGGFGGGGFGGGGAGDVGYGFGGSPGAPVARLEEKLDLAKGVAPSVGAEEVGELFRYEIKLPVSLRKNQSAMLPIVNQEVEGEKLSIYNSQAHAKHPMNGYRLKNATDLHLMQGPVTVFDGNSYAGDAQIRDLAPGASRLISYALDLDVQVSVTTAETPPQLVGVQIRNGQVETDRRTMRTTRYLVVNESTRSRKMIIEQSIDVAYRLAPQNALEEETDNVHRFGLAAESGKTAELSIEEEKDPRNRSRWAIWLMSRSRSTWPARECRMR